MFAKSFTVPITTAADGTGSGFTDVTNGRVLGVVYVPDGTTPFANNVVVTITTEVSLQAVMTKTVAAGNTAFSAYPKVQNNAVADASAIAGAFDFIPLAGNERVKIAIASGGDTKSGSFMVIVG
ncbi:MAG: hypothetical protein KGO96_12870 [Elusimicrobia bacterium]|nr:hypothetical protein [Elusimicrobiota bacterium]